MKIASLELSRTISDAAGQVKLFCSENNVGEVCDLDRWERPPGLDLWERSVTSICRRDPLVSICGRGL